jgi:Putative zinc-finger/Predicted integral membrane protein (DUF2275)
MPEAVKGRTVMQHEDIRHKLSEYIDGAVSDDERDAIEQHLKSCSECSTAIAEIRETIKQVRSLEVQEPPVWLAQRIMAQVQATAEQKKGFFQRLFFPLRVKIPVEVAAMVLIGVIALFFYRQGQLPREIAETPTDRINSGHTTKPEQEMPVRSNVRKQKSTTSRSPIGAEKTPAHAPSPAPASPEKNASEIVLDKLQERKAAEAPASPEEFRKEEHVGEAGTRLSSVPQSKTEFMTDSEKEPVRINLLVEDTAGVLAAVEKQVNRLHGEITRRDDVSIVVRIHREDLEQLLRELQHHGRVDVAQKEFQQKTGKILLKISIDKRPPQ